MTRSIPRFILLLCFAALPAVAQPVKAFVDGHVLQPDEPRTALATACDGEWLNVRRAILSGAKLDGELRTPAGQQRALCLVRAIDEQPKADTLMVQGDVDEVVAAYGIESLDFFAAHADEMSARAARATWNALLGYAQPDAMTRYFERHRQTTSRAAHGGSGSVGFYQPLLAGRCMESVCSPRLNESLQTVTRNLDVVDAELKAAESAAPETATSQAIAHNEQIRSLARELRAKVARIQRGEAALVVDQQK